MSPFQMIFWQGVVGGGAERGGGTGSAMQGPFSEEGEGHFLHMDISCMSAVQTTFAACG